MGKVGKSEALPTNRLRQIAGRRAWRNLLFSYKHPSKEDDKLLISVFLRWAKAPRTTRKKRAGSPTGTWRRFPDRHADHRGGHLGGGEEALRRHVEEELTVRRGTGRTGRRPRSPPCPAAAQIRWATSRWIITVTACEAPALQQGGDHRGGDVIGQVGAHHGRQAGELLPAARQARSSFITSPGTISTLG